MKADRLTKILLVGFVSALGLYIITFSLIQHRRTSKGPWQVVFTTDTSATPALLVSNPKLKISQRIVFAEEKLSRTNLVQSVVFDDPTKTNVPFGLVVFQDLTFFPGTVTLNYSGHEVELLPRVLIIDKREHDWKSGRVITVSGKGNIEPVIPKPKRR